MKEGWEVKCIGDCFSYIKNGANIKQEKNASGYPITRIETLANGVFNRDRMGYAGIFDIGKYNVNVLQDQDILMSHINSKAYIGRSVIYQKKENETIIHGMNLLRLIAKKDFLNPYYANYYFKTEYFKSDVAKIRKDAVNQSSMAISDLSKIKIPIPPLSEQSRIVEELDLLSNIIEKKRQQLSELDNLAQSIFYDMFGDPVTNEKGWEVKKLGKVCLIERGGSPRPISAFITNDDNGVNWIKIGDAEDGSMYINSTKEKIKPEGVKKSRMVHKGDFILSNSMSFGKPYILGVDGCIHDGWLVIRDENNVFDKSFLYYYLGSSFIYNEFKRLAVGGVVNNLNSELVRGVSVAIPSFNLQQLFAQKIEAIEKQKDLIKQSIAETEELFNSRMDYYFS